MKVEGLRGHCPRGLGGGAIAVESIGERRWGLIRSVRLECAAHHFRETERVVSDTVGILPMSPGAMIGYAQ